jgi:phosphatidylinositol alpha-mannosyltransferase
VARLATPFCYFAVTTRRIALICPYALSVYGGVQEQVLAMARTLQDRSTEVLIVAPDPTDRDDHGTTVRFERFGHRLSIPANGSRAPVTVSLRASLAAQRCVAKFSPTVVHFHEPLAPVLGYELLRRHAAPAVATFHRAGAGVAYSATRPLLKRLVRGIDEAVAVSELAASTILHGVGVQTTTLFNGFETERFREFPRSRSDTSHALFLGRLETRKGARTVLEAARLAAAQQLDWRFTIAGDGPEGPQLRREFGDLSNVDFLGAVTDEDKRRLLRSSQVLIAASTHGESFGLVLLEAMAAETPVVASDIDGYRAAAGGHATLFGARDAPALLAATQQAALSSVLMISTARRHAEQWSMQTLMDRYEEIYERAVVAYRHPQ